VSDWEDTHRFWIDHNRPLGSSLPDGYARVRCSRCGAFCGQPLKALDLVPLIRSIGARAKNHEKVCPKRGQSLRGILEGLPVTHADLSSLNVLLKH